MRTMNSEIATMKTRKDFLSKESTTLKVDNENLYDEIRRVFEQLEKESVEHVTEETKAQTLKEKLDFLKLLWELVRL